MNEQAPAQAGAHQAESPQAGSADPFRSDGSTGSVREPQFPDAPATRTATEPIRLSAADRGSRSATSSPRRRGPMVITGAVLAGALVVVGTATWVAQRPEPTPVAAPSVAPVRLTRSSAAPGSGPNGAAPSAPIQIEVGTADATATLAVPQHRWTTAGRTSPDPRLMVHVQLSVRSGTLSYDPNLVKLFDAGGRLYENVLPLGTSGELGSGKLGAGSTTDGWVAFDLPPGATTLVLSSWRGESLAAVRIPG